MNQTVQPARKLQGTLTPPPDKSISHRAALFAALHNGRSVITNFSPAADPHSTLHCLRELGVGIHQSNHTVEIEGVGRDGFNPPVQDLDCGNSGTTMRLLSGIVAGSGVKATLVGDASLSARTMKRIIDPLRKMGVEVSARDGDFAPLSIHRTQPLKPLRFDLPIPSAQLKSCVLLAGLFGEDPTQVIESTQSRDHTERLLQLKTEEQSGKRIISSSRSDTIPPQSYRIPGDFSAAAFWLAAGAIHPDAKIRLEGVGMNPTRTGAIDMLKKMGARITIKNERTEGAEPVADLSVESSELRAITIPKEQIPNLIDEIPILSVAMAFADGTSRIVGAEELRHKETDRLMAIADLLKKAGVDFEEHKDGIEIDGTPGLQPREAQFNSYHDHRIAMSAAVMALMASNSSTVLDADCAAISYPDFWKDLSVLTI